MAYLTEGEIVTYCTVVPGITPDEVNIASGLIDSYTGIPFTEETYEEVTRLNKKRTPYGYVYKGKLSKYPVTSITSVKAYLPSGFGGEQEQNYEVNSIRLDPSKNGYFQFLLPSNTFAPTVLNLVPYELYIEFKAGYTIYPENLKIACGLLAQNIKQSGGFLAWKDKSDLDYKVSLADSSLFTDDIKRLIDSVRIK